MGKPKVLRGIITAKVRTDISSEKDLRILNNKGNWELAYIGPTLETGEVTSVEIVKASVDK